MNNYDIERLCWLLWDIVRGLGGCWGERGYLDESKEGFLEKEELERIEEEERRGTVRF